MQLERFLHDKWHDYSKMDVLFFILAGQHVNQPGFFQGTEFFII
jgi:hypothetical protein